MEEPLLHKRFKQEAQKPLNFLTKFIVCFDMIFIKYAFKSRFDKQKEKTKANVDKLVTDLQEKLGLEEEESRIVWLEWMTTWYLAWFLAPTTFLVERSFIEVMVIFFMIIAGCVANTVDCFQQLVDEPRELDTFQKLQHSPMSGAILLGCTHFICVMFSYYNLKKIRSDSPKLAYPLLYCFFVGKWLRAPYWLFMAMRMVLAYSSGKMGAALDYFFWQEIILTLCHALGSFLFVEAPDDEKSEFPEQIKQCLWHVLYVDGGKTVIIALFWLHYQPGRFANLVDRMPDQNSQIVFALVIHFIMDMVQSLVTFFTIYIGKWRGELMKCQLIIRWWDAIINFIMCFDMLFLERTFKTRGKPAKTGLEDSWEASETSIPSSQWQLDEKIDELVDKLKSNLDIESEQITWLDWATFWYLQYFLGPSTFFVEKHTKVVLMFVGVVIFGCVMHTAYCLFHLVDEPRDLYTFKKLEHSPLSGVVLLGCTHFICVMFSYYNLTKLREDKPKLAHPLLYCFFVGKGFMVGRMVLSYSSGKMGQALDYFIWQEVILTFCHAVGSFVIVAAPDIDKKTPLRAQIKECLMHVLIVDGGKTVVIAMFWWHYQPGLFANLVDRMGTQTDQIVFALVIHFVMDMVQSMVTFFTIYLGKWGEEILGTCRGGSEKRDDQSLAPQVKKSDGSMDDSANFTTASSLPAAYKSRGLDDVQEEADEQQRKEEERRRIEAEERQRQEAENLWRQKEADEHKLKEEARRRQNVEDHRRQEEAEEQQRKEEERRRIESEERQRQEAEDLQRQKEAVEHRLKEEERRLKESEDRRRQEEAEEKQRKEEERQRTEAEQRLRQEAEHLKRQKEADEHKLKEEERRRQESEDRRRQDEADQQKRKEEERRRIEASERQRREADEYKLAEELRLKESEDRRRQEEAEEQQRKEEERRCTEAAERQRQETQGHQRQKQAMATVFPNGANVEYLSETMKKWIPAVVQGFDTATGTYNLDRRAMVTAEKVRATTEQKAMATVFPNGAKVEYSSETMKQWIPAVVQSFDTATGTYNLDCRAMVMPEKVRAPTEQQVPRVQDVGISRSILSNKYFCTIHTARIFKTQTTRTVLELEFTAQSDGSRGGLENPERSKLSWQGQAIQKVVPEVYYKNKLPNHVSGTFIFHDVPPNIKLAFVFGQAGYIPLNFVPQLCEAQNSRDLIGKWIHTKGHRVIIKVDLSFEDLRDPGKPQTGALTILGSKLRLAKLIGTLNGDIINWSSGSTWTREVQDSRQIASEPSPIMQAAYQQMDLNHDGQVSQEEFVKYNDAKEVLRQHRRAGLQIQQAKSGGYPALLALGAGYSSEELRRARYSETEIEEALLGLEEFRKRGE